MLIPATHSSSLFFIRDSKSCLSCQHWRGGASSQICVQPNSEIILKLILTGVVRRKCHCDWVSSGGVFRTHAKTCARTSTDTCCYRLRQWMPQEVLWKSEFPANNYPLCSHNCSFICVFNDLLGGICRVIVGSWNRKTLLYLKEPTMTQQIPAANHKKRMVKLTSHVHHG